MGTDGAGPGGRLWARHLHPATVTGTAHSAASSTTTTSTPTMTTTSAAPANTRLPLGKVWDSNGTQDRVFKVEQCVKGWIFFDVNKGTVISEVRHAGGAAIWKVD